MEVQDTVANYTSDFSFSIDGVSSNTLGVFVDTLEPVPHAQQRYTTGLTRKPYAIPDEVYNEISYSIAFYKFFPSDMDDKEIRKFLSKGSVLQLSNLPTVYFNILTMSCEVSQRADNRRIDYVLTFTLEPYRYGLSNPWINISSGATVANAGNITSYPLIELTDPDGDIVLTVNDIDYELKGLTASETETPNKVYIDRERFIIYDQNNMLMIGKDDGKMPELIVGNNSISWTGDITAVRLKTNWREI